MKYIFGLFSILALVFFAPAIVTIVDMYTWYFYGNTLTGLDYSGVRPLVMMLCGVIGAACAVTAGAFALQIGSNLEVKK